jgi:RNA polymerase sigma factor FliA
MRTDIETAWKTYVVTRCPEIKDKLILEYLPIVKYVASRMLLTLPSSVEYDDLVSAGVLGLIGSLERYDINQGVKFETFVLPRIKGAILDELRTLDWAPRSLRSKARKLDRAMTELEKELGRNATDEEVAERLEMDYDQFYYLQNEINSAALLSLDGTFQDDMENKNCMYDVIKNNLVENPLSNIEQREFKKVLMDVIDHLPEQEKLVIALYYYEELTLREIGKVMSITESRVSQIHTKAIADLKYKLANEFVAV